MNAIIVCGGLSTRLGERTKTTPKVLLPIGPKRVIDWQLEKLQAAGCDTVVLAAGHLSDVLREAVGDESHGMKLIHAVEPTKLGTGGAIKFAWTHLPDQTKPTLIINGDVLTTESLSDMIASLDESKDGMIFGTKVADAATYGTLAFNDAHELLSFKEKEGKHEAGYINGGIYIFTPKMHDYFPDVDAFSIEYDVFPKVEHFDVFVSDKPWIDIGVPERLAWAEAHWQQFEV